MAYSENSLIPPFTVMLTCKYPLNVKPMSHFTKTHTVFGHGFTCRNPQMQQVMYCGIVLFNP